jgi:uncharacterized DUF497 family protein
VHTIPEGYEWDDEKARSNLRKHGIDFADAVGVFDDESALTMADALTAVDEQRQLTLGRDWLGRILLVAYTWRGARIRVFSARRASPQEGRQYREGRR